MSELEEDDSNPMVGPPPELARFELTSAVERAHAGWVARGRKGIAPVALDHKRVVARISGGLLTSARFAYCDLGDSEITFTDLEEALLSHCASKRFVANQSQLNRARIDATSLVGSQAMITYFERALITDSDFSRAELDRASFTEAEIRGTKFVAARLRDTRFDRARVEGCDFREADFTHEELALRRLGRFVGTRFVSCDFRGANFTGRRLENTVFERCRLAGIVGKPAIEGPYQVIEADLSAAGDGSDLRDQAALDALWR